MRQPPKTPFTYERAPSKVAAVQYTGVDSVREIQGLINRYGRQHLRLDTTWGAGLRIHCNLPAGGPWWSINLSLNDWLVFDPLRSPAHGVEIMDPAEFTKQYRKKKD